MTKITPDAVEALAHRLDRRAGLADMPLCSEAATMLRALSAQLEGAPQPAGGDEVERLRAALESVREDILGVNGLNTLSIVDTVWHDTAETTVDFIDAVLDTPTEKPFDAPAGGDACPHEAWTQVHGVRRCADCGTEITPTEKPFDAPAVQAASELHSALKLAIAHIKHMAAWIGPLKSGYSFEAIGEDMPGMLAALTAPVESQPEHSEVGKLIEAADAIITRMHSSYKARNGRRVGIQGDDGEKCWIVHSDEIFALQTALADLRSRTPMPHPLDAKTIEAFQRLRDAWADAVRLESIGVMVKCDDLSTALRALSAAPAVGEGK